MAKRDRICSRNLVTAGLSALLLAMTVTLVVPLDIAANNLDETGSDLSALLVAGLAACAMAAAGGLLVAWLLSKVTKSALPSALLAVIALASLANGLFLVGDYGLVDGRGLTISPNSGLAIAQYTLAGALLVCAILFRSSPLLPRAVLLGVLLGAGVSTANGLALHGAGKINWRAELGSFSESLLRGF